MYQSHLQYVLYQKADARTLAIWLSGYFNEQRNIPLSTWARSRVIMTLSWNI